MKRYLKIIAFVCLMVILLTVMQGCAYRGYRGDYAGAYTLIYSQVPDILGARTNGPLLLDPQILLWESDEYGRALFIYFERSDELLSVGIVQKEEGNRVFFYPEKSTISARIPDDHYDIDNHAYTELGLTQLMYSLFTVFKIEEFKAENDWGLPIDESKLDSAEIVLPKIAARWEHRKDSVNLAQLEWEEQIIALAHKNGHEFDENEDFYFSHASYMATDAYGRRLYYVEGYYYIYPDDDSHIWYVKYDLEMIAIINPDGTFDGETFMVELEDKANYQEQIRDLKIANGWNQPLE